jgi:hypothetical protein
MSCGCIVSCPSNIHSRYCWHERHWNEYVTTKILSDKASWSLHNRNLHSYFDNVITLVLLCDITFCTIKK